MLQALAHRGTSYDVISKLHRFGGIEFCISSGRAGIEMGHIHGNHIADLPFPLQIRNELINSGRVSHHHIVPQSGWVSYWIRWGEEAKEKEIAAVIDLFRMQFNRLVCAASHFRGKVRSEFCYLPPSCEKCGSYLRPDVVWFGEGISREVWNQAVMHSITCDVMIIVGTSLAVSPANKLHSYAKNNRATLVEINPEDTPFSYEMDFSIRKTAVDALSRLDINF